MKHFRFTFALAAIILSATACQKEEILPVENTVTHSVSFITGAPQTRTTATPDGDVVNYAWTSADENRFTVYEKVGDTFTPANETIGILDEGNGKMSLMAVFAGEAPAEAQYQALFNSGVQSIQFGTQTEYDQNSDVLASLPVDAATSDTEALNLQFMRMSSISRATLKQLTIDEASLPSGSVIKSVSVETVGDGATDLAAGYSIEDGCFAAGGKRIEIRNADITVASDAANVFFASVPAYNKYVRMAATAYSSEGEFLTAYEKTFTKTISFEKGDMYYFGVKMDELKSQTFNLTVAPEISTSDSLVWRTGLMKIVSKKSGSSTAANNYCPPANTTTRVYKNFELDFVPLTGVSIESIVITAATDAYATTLYGAGWQNGLVSVSGSAVTVIPVEGKSEVSAAITGTSGLFSITVNYGIPAVVGAHNVTISGSIEHGTVESDYSKAVAGSTINLTATPETGYKFSSWAVTNVSTSEAITVTDDSFVMPDADVLVSATFIKDNGIRKVSISVGSTSLSGSYVSKTFVLGDITFGCTNWLKSVNSIQMKANSSDACYNVTPFEHLRRIRLVMTTPSQIVMYAGNSERPTTEFETRTAASPMEFDFFDANVSYFSMKNSVLAKVDSIIVEYGRVPVLDSVLVSGTLTKKIYAEGDTLETNGLVVTAVYQDGTRRDVSTKVSWTKSPSGPLSSGTTSASFIASYKGVSSAEYAVTGISVTAAIHVTSVSLDRTEAELNVGSNLTLTATVAPSDATNKNLIWSSSDASVATVANGVVTAVSAGSAVISATSVDGGKVAGCNVQVKDNQNTAIYTVASRTSVTTTGTAPAGSSATFANTYTTKEQMTSGNTQTLTLNGYAGKKIVGLVLTMRSNKSAGTGYLSLTSTTSSSVTTTLGTIGTQSSPLPFNYEKWHGSYTTEYVDVEVSLSNDDHLIATGETVTLVIGCTTNSLYCKEFKVQYADSGSQTASTWLDSYEVPANNMSAVTTSNVLYNGFYSHATVNETYGTTKAAVYNTSSSSQKIVVHTFSYNTKVLPTYTMLFDQNKKCALWVACRHNATDYRDEDVGRSDDAWAYDPALDQSWQARLSSGYKSTNSLSYDRGHQIASNDRQTTAEQNKQTFYYSNMTPQFSSLNQGQWANAVEAPVQAAMAAISGTDELYIVTGPLFEGEVHSYATDNDGAACPTPTGYYKCLMRCSFDGSGNVTAASGCAYIVETNSSNTAPTLTSIDYVEGKAGFNFFANVPDSYENAAESQTAVFW